MNTAATIEHSQPTGWTLWVSPSPAMIKALKNISPPKKPTVLMLHPKCPKQTSSSIRLAIRSGCHESINAPKHLFTELEIYSLSLLAKRMGVELIWRGTEQHNLPMQLSLI